MKTIGSWSIIDGEIKYDNPWIKVVEHRVINPGGGEGIYGKVNFKNIAVGVIPIDEEGYTWLVGQHRFTLDEFSWEIPEGGAPMSEDLLTAAKRELKEETGLEADSWEMIMKMHTSNSVTDEVAFIFLARGLTEGISEPEETESDLMVRKLPFDEAVKMVMAGEITDGMSIAGILKVEQRIK